MFVQTLIQGFALNCIQCGDSSNGYLCNDDTDGTSTKCLGGVTICLKTYCDGDIKLTQRYCGPPTGGQTEDECADAVSTIFSARKLRYENHLFFQSTKKCHLIFFCLEANAEVFYFLGCFSSL